MEPFISKAELTNILFEKVKEEDVEALSMLGDLYFWNRNYEKALEWYTITDAKNHADGQYMLGIIYHHGFGVPQDDQRALDYFLKAYKNGKPTAGTSIGRAYHFGFEAEQDYEKAMSYYTAAANNGDFNAEYFIGLLYEQGDGVEMNVQLALEWYERSAENGSKAAKISKDRLYDEGYKSRKKQNESIKVELSKAKNKLIECENENHHLKEEAKRLAKDITTIRKMYGAYKEHESKSVLMKADSSQIQKGYARIILKYIAGEDADDNDDDDDDE